VKIFLAGATGVLGVRLVPLLVDAGHDVVGMTRSPAKADILTELGATPVVCDVFGATALTAAVVDAAPDLVMHQLTDLPDDHDHLGPEVFAANARIRVEGTDNLLAAARAASAPRVVAQSIAWRASNPDSVDHLERAVVGVGGVVLRYGQFHGPGTWARTADDIAGDGPKVSVDHAAAATLTHLTAPTGTYTVTD
jgi:hypothetical protein